MNRIRKPHSLLRPGAPALLSILLLFGPSGCGNKEEPDVVLLPDWFAPVTIANPGGGAYSTVQYVTLAANEAATIYYTLDGSEPAQDAPDTTSCASPSSWIRVGAGTTVVKFFSIDGSGNQEAVKTETYVIIFPTTPQPVANAGPDHSGVAAGTQVTLDGSGSTAASGIVLSYQWTLVSRPAGSAAALSSGTAVRPTITPDKVGPYVLSLSVTDGITESAADQVTITAVNSAPVALAGPDQNVATGAIVALDGSGSYDASGDAITYAWSLASPAGSLATLSSTSVPNPTFTADQDGTYVLSLVVNDGAIDSAADIVRVIAPVAASGPVPDTGQTASYTGTFGEDHDYTINPPSYTDNSNGTITDMVTGLLWQKQDDGVMRTWGAAQTYCGNLFLDGGGWRLPNVFELMTIARYGTYSPAINAASFPGTKSWYYWSDTTYSGNGLYAWGISFYYGSAAANYKTDISYTRCVRGEQRSAVLLDNDDGTVIDKTTNLMWQKRDDAAGRTWEQALSYCEGLSLDGFTDWRLPNIKELSSIIDHNRYMPSINTTCFPNAQSSYYWSSTTDYSSSATAWRGYFSGGQVSSSYKTNLSYARCVRGEQ